MDERRKKPRAQNLTTTATTPTPGSAEGDADTVNQDLALKNHAQRRAEAATQNEWNIEHTNDPSKD